MCKTANTRTFESVLYEPYLYLIIYLYEYLKHKVDLLCSCRKQWQERARTGVVRDESCKRPRLLAHNRVRVSSHPLDLVMVHHRVLLFLVERTQREDHRVRYKKKHRTANWLVLALRFYSLVPRGRNSFGSRWVRFHRRSLRIYTPSKFFTFTLPYSILEHLLFFKKKQGYELGFIFI